MYSIKKNKVGLRLLLKYKNAVIPAGLPLTACGGKLKREYSVLLQKIISPIEDFGDDINFCKSLSLLTSIFVKVFVSFMLILNLFPAANASDRGIGLVDKKQEISQIPLGNFYAVLIGIDDYDYWPRLSTAVKDINAIEDVLRTRYGFADNRIKRLTNRDATREGILESLEWLINNAGENDNVLIYYAGHGELDKVSGYWVPIEAKQDKKGAYISNSTIRDYISAMKAKHVYLVADSCFSGSLFAGATRSKPPSVTGRYYQEVYNRMSRQGLTSGGTEPVSDEGYGGHSIFAYYFLKTLQENNDPFLTATSLFDRIAVPIANNSKQTPVSRPIRDVRDEGGEFIFALAGGQGSFGMISDAGSGMGSIPHSGSSADTAEQKNMVVSTLEREKPLRVLLILSEKNKGKQSGDSIVGSILSEKLGEGGFRIVSEAAIGKREADKIKNTIENGGGIVSMKDEIRSFTDSVVWGSVDTRSGQTGIEGLVSCIADASVQVVSVETGEVIVQKNLSNVRGFGAKEERACIVALQKMGEEMSKIIIEKLGG